MEFGKRQLRRLAGHLEARAEGWRRPVAWICAVNLALAISGASALLTPRGTPAAARYRTEPTAALLSTVAGTARSGGATAASRTSSGRATPAGARAATAAAATPGPVSPQTAQPGDAGAQAAALDAVAGVGGLPLRPGDLTMAVTQPVLSRSGVCPSNRLQVVWSAPPGQYDIGGYISPLGPAPTPGTTDVNGIVLCQGSTYEYMGFEARWDGQRWSAIPVPSASDDHGPRLSSDDTVAPPTPAQPAPSPAATVGPASVVTGPWGAQIEDLAAYVPQSACDPTPKPGVVGVRNLLLQSFAGSRDLGIGQSCDTPDGVSEHKEGRAFDWGVRADVPAENAMANQLLAWLFAPDQYGNQYAMIRRLGIMYLIWNDHIWGSYAADQGWRPYGGPNPHTDHIHISFSWAGALGQTSFWTGQVATVGLVAPPPGAIPPPAPAQPAALVAAGPPAPSAPPASPSNPTTPPGTSGSQSAAGPPSGGSTSGSGSSGTTSSGGSPSSGPPPSTTTTTSTTMPSSVPTTVPVTLPIP